MSLRQFLFVQRNKKAAAWIVKRGQLTRIKLHGDAWCDFTSDYWDEFKDANQIMDCDLVDAILLSDVADAFDPLPNWLNVADTPSAWDVEKLVRFAEDVDFQSENILLVQGTAKKVVGNPDQFHFDKYYLYSSCAFNLAPKSLCDALRDGEGELSGIYEVDGGELQVERLFHLLPHSHVTIRNCRVVFEPEGAFVLSDGSFISFENCQIELSECGMVPIDACAAVSGSGAVKLDRCAVTGKGTKRFAQIRGSNARLEMAETVFHDVHIIHTHGDYAEIDAASFINVGCNATLLMSKVYFRDCEYHGEGALFSSEDYLDGGEVVNGFKMQECAFLRCVSDYYYNGTRMGHALLCGSGELVRCSFVSCEAMRNIVDWGGWPEVKSMVEDCVFETCQAENMIFGSGVLRGLDFMGCKGEWLVGEGFVSEADIRIKDCEVDHVVSGDKVLMTLSDRILRGECRDRTLEEAELYEEQDRRMRVVRM